MLGLQFLYFLPLVVTVMSQSPNTAYYGPPNAWNQGSQYASQWSSDYSPKLLNKAKQFARQQPYIPPNELPECQPTTTTTTTTALPTTMMTTTTTTTTTPKPLGEVVPYFYCSKGDGHYADPTSCGSYITCVNNIAYRQYCPIGLYFNPNAQWNEFVCASPSQVYCPLDVPPTTTTTTTTTPRPLGEVVNNFYCSKGNGNYADPTSCGSYITCQNNIAYKQYCPIGLYFNSNAKWNEDVCASPSQVYCPLNVQREPDTHQGQQAELSNQNPTCIGRPSPICVKRNAYYPVDMSCDSYIECRDHTARNMTCPDGMHFNMNATWPDYPCGYPMDVPCASGRQPQPANPTAECPHQYGFFASPRATRQYCTPYRQCVGGKAIEMNCTMGLAFNPEHGRCEWPYLVPSCDADAFLGFKCPPTPLDAFGKSLDLVYNYKYEGNCYYFFSCKLGKARLLACDLGMAFDPVKGACVNDELVQCGDSKRVGEKECDKKE